MLRVPSPRTVQAAGGATTAAASGLTNNTPYSVAVQAWNGAGAGPFGPAVQMQSAGTPPAVTGVNGATRGPGAGFDSESVTVNWNQQTNPNGPPIKSYTIYRNGARIGSVGAQTRTFADTIPYDGNRYSYTVTTTNGADKESPQSSPWTYTSVGTPTAPTSVNATTPSPNKAIAVTVTLGKSRDARFANLRWTSGGKSGTHPCSCGNGASTSFVIPNAGISPQTVTVYAVNAGGQRSSETASGQVQPYGPTLTPTNLTADVNGRTIVWRWDLRTNGRPIDNVQIKTDGGNWRQPDNRQSHSQTFGYSEGHNLRVRAHAEGTGWSAEVGPRGATTVPEPKNPEIYGVSFSGNYIDFKIRDFPGGGGGWTINFNHKGYAGSFTSSSPVNVNGSGNGYSWGGNYFVAAKNPKGDLVITMTRGGAEVRTTVKR